MKLYGKVLLGLCGLLLFASCVKTTEKYASKEHGMKFGSWTLNYDSGDYDVYWPSIRMSEPVTGNLTEVVRRGFFENWGSSKKGIVTDTTSNDAFLMATIKSVKSSHDAQYYSSIRFKYCDKNAMFRQRCCYHFIFNEGQVDSVSFLATANKEGQLVPNRETSEGIIKLLSGSSPVSLKITYCDEDMMWGRKTEGKYTFSIKGEPQLRKAQKLNQERKIIADKEFDKADAKLAKELGRLFN